MSERYVNTGVENVKNGLLVTTTQTTTTTEYFSREEDLVEQLGNRKLKGISKYAGGIVLLFASSVTAGFSVADLMNNQSRIGVDTERDIAGIVLGAGSVPLVFDYLGRTRREIDESDKQIKQIKHTSTSK